ncbi:hypothetical protein [Streptomyces sp. NPDC058751]
MTMSTRSRRPTRWRTAAVPVAGGLPAATGTALVGAADYGFSSL